jgi:hypothetical protein
VDPVVCGNEAEGLQETVTTAMTTRQMFCTDTNLLWQFTWRKRNKTNVIDTFKELNHDVACISVVTLY